MAVRIRLDINGVEKTDESLTRFGARARDLRPAWDEIADSFGRWMTRQFDSQGSYSTGRWAPLSPQYGKYKASHFPGTRILQRTSQLRNQLTQQPFGVDVREPGYLILGAALKIANYHQDGTSRMPQRQIIKLFPAERTRWRKIIQKHLINGEG